MPTLTVSNLKAGYGAGDVLDDVSVSIPEGGHVALVGANGAGKSTFVKTINGLLKARAGQILWDGKSIGDEPGYKRTLSGLATVAEGRLLFGELSVYENLVAASLSGEQKRRRGESLEQVFALFPRLFERKAQQALTMSGGEQQMLAIARALMTLPRLLVLDEPSIGLSPKVVVEIFAALAKLKDRGLSLLLIEQNIQLSLRSVDYAYVLVRGRIALEGPSRELLASDEIRKAYFGVEV